MAVNELRPPHITDQPIIARMKRIGLETGKSFDLPLLRVTGSRCPDERRVLLDRIPRKDLAIKVLGVGSVGTFCAVMLMMADIDDPLFLQVKEAGPSGLEPYAGKSIYANHGQRVVNGLRLMQSASDLFLGWTEGRHFCVRQLHDMKIKLLVGRDVHTQRDGPIRGIAVGRWHGHTPGPANRL